MGTDPRLASVPAVDFTLPSWEAAFNYLADIAGRYTPSMPLVVVIDEFTYLAQSEPAIASLLQRAWDHRLSKLDGLRMILSGSLVGIMEKQVLSGQSPLYGRATALMRLRPLTFGSLSEIMPAWSPAERVAAYAVCGGIPSYLALFAEAPSFARGLRDHVLSPGSMFLTDAALLLNERLNDPFVYASVLAAVASGFHGWTDIARLAGVPVGNLGHYLQTLQALGMVERRDPVLAQAGGRRGRYHVSDPFLRFYYRFIVPHRTAIERGELARASKTIAEDLRGFIGVYVFEDLCREWVRVEAERGGFGFLPEQIGAYWGRTGGRRGQSIQLDVVAVSRRDQHVLIGEAKWGDKPVPREVLTSLIERSQHMPQVADGWPAQYVLFGRAGFTDAVLALAKATNARLVGLNEIERTLASGV
jgi:AAA+ ATPase superfamily predicted ATPase